MSPKKNSVREFTHYMQAEYLLACTDALVGQDSSVSLIRVIDQLHAFALPLRLQRLTVVAQFFRNTDITDLREFVSAQLELRFVVQNPSGKITELGGGPIAIQENAAWTNSRTMLDLSSRLHLLHEGIYTWKVLGRTAGTDFQVVAEKKIPVVLLKGIPGFYTVEFHAGTDASTDMKGSGNAFLNPDGTVQGGDPGYAYAGNYAVAEDGTVKVNLRIKRTDPSILSIFGDMEEFGLTLEGKSHDGIVEVLNGIITEDPSKSISIRLARKTQLGPASGEHS